MGHEIALIILRFIHVITLLHDGSLRGCQLIWFNKFRKRIERISGRHQAMLIELRNGPQQVLKSIIVARQGLTNRHDEGRQFPPSAQKIQTPRSVPYNPGPGIVSDARGRAQGWILCPIVRTSPIPSRINRQE
jgi:hypothetical protein